MEKEAFKQFKEEYVSVKNINVLCKEYKIECDDVNKKEKLNYFTREYQKVIRKKIKYLVGKEKIKYGFVYNDVSIYNDVFTNNYISITDENSYIILDDYLLDMDNDIKYDFFDLFNIIEIIIKYNRIYKKLNKLLKNKEKIINIFNFNKISQIFKYKDLNINQYQVLEDYFDKIIFPNQLKNNIINYFIHNIPLMNLEILLKSGSNKFINPISANTFDSIRGIYTTLKTDKCEVSSFAEKRPSLIFSKDLANDYGYIFNFDFQYGFINKETLIKGQTFQIKGKEYSALEKGIILLCNKKYKNRTHEVIFYTDHIKLKDYLESIIFHNQEDYQLFKNMKDVKYKNKMKYIPL